MMLNTLEYVDNLLKQSKDSTDIDKIKNVFKLLSKKKMIILIILIMII